MYTSYESTGKAFTPRWILVLGGLGIVAGLSTWGYKMIKVCDGARAHGLQIMLPGAPAISACRLLLLPALP